MHMDDNYDSGKSQTFAQQSVSRDFSRLTTLKQRKKFIKKIFNGDHRDYEKFISLIQNITNWKDAYILIDFYFYKNGVDPASKDALEFRDIFYHIYFSK